MNAYERIRRGLAMFAVDGERLDALAALAELEKAATPQFVASEVTQEMCLRAYSRRHPNEQIDSSQQRKRRRGWAREWLEAWRAELGPALGLVEIREPTPEECERIENQFTVLNMRLETSGGRDMFDAVSAVMWPKEGL